MTTQTKAAPEQEITVLSIQQSAAKRIILETLAARPGETLESFAIALLLASDEAIAAGREALAAISLAILFDLVPGIAPLPEAAPEIADAQ